jgi:cytochrome c oxidase subunit II
VRSRGRVIAAFVLVWAVLTAAGISVLNALPIPPGDATDVAKGESQLIRLLSEMAWPIFLGVLLTLGFALFVNRYLPAPREPHAEKLRGHRPVQVAWITISSCLVMSLAITGTIALANDSRINVTDPSTNQPPLQVQVIAQQWMFTYRYPSYGGIETPQLVLPANREVEFHVTSLDVVHSFWFYAAGVKLDAVPGVDNVQDMLPLQTGTYLIECAELCGIWHAGMMQTNAQIVDQYTFQEWIQQEQQLDAPVMKYLPPYSTTYVPQPGTYGS